MMIRRKWQTYILNNLHGMTFPGWEPERMAKIKDLFAMYKDIE